MRYLLCLALAMLAGAAWAQEDCGQTGIKGALSDDGRYIVRREVVTLRQQALEHDGYAAAADFMERNRQAIDANPRIDAGIKHQVDIDMSANVAGLRCWARRCDRHPAERACRL
jgi:hypothetical protein